MEPELISKQIKRKKKQQFAELALAAKIAKERGGKPFIFHFLTTQNVIAISFNSLKISSRFSMN